MSQSTEKTAKQLEDFTFALSSLNGTNGFNITGTVGDCSLSNAEDVIADMTVGDCSLSNVEDVIADILARDPVVLGLRQRAGAHPSTGQQVAAVPAASAGHSPR
jgi:hypothetical protein